MRQGIVMMMTHCGKLCAHSLSLLCPLCVPLLRVLLYFYVVFYEGHSLETHTHTHTAHRHTHTAHRHKYVLKKGSIFILYIDTLSGPLSSPFFGLGGVVHPNRSLSKLSLVGIRFYVFNSNQLLLE
jgi:hypothetical protein